ncbi:hypothetical protein, partial [Methanospirillum sp.]|uniref:hypothetical protein n=1 Tax=Methanospirillum sp. TaxID=45200 RepID=UPI001BD29690
MVAGVPCRVYDDESCLIISSGVTTRKKHGLYTFQSKVISIATIHGMMRLSSTGLISSTSPAT